MLTVRMGSKVPLVEQLVTGIRCAIARGELGVNDPLPTVRQLAGDLKINQNTVARAYRELEATGLVRSKRGRGTVVVAVREDRKAPVSQVRAELGLRLRGILADWRLAGFDKSRMLDLMTREVDGIWPEVES